MGTFELIDGDDDGERPLDEAELNASTLRLLAHDINNPLAAIRILAEMLRDDVPEEHRRDIVDILEAADLASAVVAGVADRRFDPADDFTWFPLDLVELLRRAVDRPALRRHVTLDLPRELQVGGDHPALYRAFTDILVNGRRLVDANRSMGITAVDLGTSVRVSISHQSHVTIPAPMRRQLFERRGVVALRRNRIPVSAVGLVDAHAIIVGHGGTLSFEDCDGGGMIVVVELPR